MSTPTLSMRMFGQEQRAKGLARIRSEAAKKAWCTRRRLAKPSPTMKKILAWLASHESARLALHYHGTSLYHVSACYINADGSGCCPDYNWPRRVTRTTFRSMEKRGWLEYVRRRESGVTMGTLPSGKRGIVSRSFDLDYRISVKGRKILAKAKG